MQQWETYRPKPEDRDRCYICGSTEGLMVYDGEGYGPEPLNEPGTAVSLCDRCQAWACRTLLAAEIAQDRPAGDQPPQDRK